MFMSVTDDLGHCHFCSSTHGDVIGPRINTKTFGQKRFAVDRPVIWNKLPTSIRNIRLSLNCFRREMRTFYFHRVYLRLELVTVFGCKNARTWNVWTELNWGQLSLAAELTSMSLAIWCDLELQRQTLRSALLCVPVWLNEHFSV